MSHSRCIDVIYSFELGPQEDKTLKFLRPPAEAGFLLDALKAIEIDRRPLLRKILACQVAQSEFEADIEWLKRENRKFYFEGPCD